MVGTVFTTGHVPKPAAAVRVIGIDLGTTNSTVAELLWEPNGETPCPVRCLSIDQQTTQGRYTHVLVPSIVALYRDEVWVGEGAKRLRAMPGAGLEEYKSWFAEAKNDMGVRRTYHRAPAGFGSVRAVAAEILKFLHSAAIAESDIPISRVVVTVPASFQAAQRHDTVAATQRAGLSLSEGELLLYQESGDQPWVFYPAVLPSQYMRRLLANVAGISDWDWRRSGWEDALLATKSEVCRALSESP